MPSIFTTSIHTQFATAFCFIFSRAVFRATPKLTERLEEAIVGDNQQINNT